MPHHMTQPAEHEPVRKNPEGDRPGVPEEAKPAASPDLDARERRLFRSLDLDNDGYIPRSALAAALGEAGLGSDDLRLAESLLALQDTAGRGVLEPRNADVSEDEFCAAVRHNILLIERALQGDLVIPDFRTFTVEIDAIYQQCRENRQGRAADYIPQLDVSGEELDRFGVSLCTTDGQRYDGGDFDTFFSVQSTCKPINYCLALEEHGEDQVHRYVGHEPSGFGFNELTLDGKNRPHNPMLNAGGIMTSALIRHKERQDRDSAGKWTERDSRAWSGDRFGYVLEYWKRLCGGYRPHASLPTYLSESRTADRNFALGYYMREKRSFPEGTDLKDVLDFFFQCCSIEMNTQLMAVVGGTLANGGICPVTGERVFSTESVRSCLAMMSSCGMYDYSGEFAFTVGLPSKSGVSGAILTVIPNVAGFCLYSPRLDENGNSVRGIEFCRRLVTAFNFHNFDSLNETADKPDPRSRYFERRASEVSRQIWAASKGDVTAIQQQWFHGEGLNGADYDGRTPLHLAAVEGRKNVIEFFIEQHRKDPSCVDLNPRDRWGQTPLDEASGNGHRPIAGLLAEAGATGTKGRQIRNVIRLPSRMETTTSIDMIWAASMGDMGLVRCLVARGMSLTAGDYDRRTPLHLSSAEGRWRIVRYLIDHGAPLDPVDRWGNTPLDDAVRHNQTHVAELLRQAGAKRGSGTPHG